MPIKIWVFFFRCSDKIHNFAKFPTPMLTMMTLVVVQWAEELGMFYGKGVYTRLVHDAWKSRKLPITVLSMAR